MSALADLLTSAEAFGDAKKRLRDRTRAFRSGDDRALMDQAREALAGARDGLLRAASLYASSTRKLRRSA